MKKHSLRVLLAFVITAGFFVPQSSSAQAASWHAPNGILWTVKPICRDGVEIIMRYEVDNPSGVMGPFTFYFDAVRANNWQTGPAVPLKQSGDLAIHQRYGRIDLVVASRPNPLPWTDDESGTTGQAYVYGKARLKWQNLFTKKQLLPLETPVVVKTDGDRYFLGGVTDCYLF